MTLIKSGNVRQQRKMFHLRKQKYNEKKGRKPIHVSYTQFLFLTWVLQFYRECEKLCELDFKVLSYYL